MLENKDSYLWVEKYKPLTVNECILPKRIKEIFQEYVDSGEIKNYLAVGSAGSGKTSSAKALLNELNIQYLFINASSEGNIDNIREKVVKFASTKSIMSTYKVILLDECDGLSFKAQQALRGIIEEFYENCRFILTANYENKVIDALQSRCPTIDFNFTSDEKKEMLRVFLPRVVEILKENNITFEKSELIDFVVKRFPDFRKTLQLLQRNTVDGTLTLNYTGTSNDEKIQRLIGYLKERDFDNMRKWVTENLDNEGVLLRRSLYENLFSELNIESIPTLILILNDYDRMEVQVKDLEIHTVAMCITIMQECEFK